MHIPDGVLPAPVLIAGMAVGGGLCGWSAWRLRDEEVPRVAVFTAAFFVASLIHFKVSITSVHLLFNGMVGVVLGRRCTLALFIGLMLQALLFGHGGLSVLGVNTCVFAIPSMICWGLYLMWRRWPLGSEFLVGAVCGALGVLLSALLFMGVILSLGESFKKVAEFALIAHLPIMLVEAIVTGFVLQFITRVQPMLLRREST